MIAENDVGVVAILADAVEPLNSTMRLRVLLSNTTLTTEYGTSGAGTMQAADFDGDGFTDLFLCSRSSLPTILCNVFWGKVDGSVDAKLNIPFSSTFGTCAKNEHGNDYLDITGEKQLPASRRVTSSLERMQETTRQTLSFLVVLRARWLLWNTLAQEPSMCQSMQWLATQLG